MTPFLKTFTLATYEPSKQNTLIGLHLTTLYLLYFLCDMRTKACARGSYPRATLIPSKLARHRRTVFPPPFRFAFTKYFSNIKFFYSLLELFDSNCPYPTRRLLEHLIHGFRRFTTKWVIWCFRGGPFSTTC